MPKSASPPGIEKKPAKSKPQLKSRQSDESGKSVSKGGKNSKVSESAGYIASKRKK